MTQFWTALAALAASLSAVAAAIYTWFTFRLVKGQSEPRVVVFVCGDPERQTILMIRIANIGRDVARDIAFRTSRPVPSHAYGLTAEDAAPAAVLTDGPLIDGIPVLGPGDTRDITWGQYGGLMKTVGKEPIEVTYTYKHGRRTFRGDSRLEVSSFTGTDASENPPAKAVRMLEEISKSLKTMAEESRRPHTERQARDYVWRRLRDNLPSDEKASSPAPEADSA